MTKRGIKDGVGNLCPKCGVAMERRKHPPEYFNKQTDQQYYFSKWDYCLRCKHLQHYERFKTPFEKKHTHSLVDLLERYKTIKVTVPDTLFDIEPDWEQLKLGRCPFCGNRLTVPRTNKIAICKGKRHPNKKPFVIGLNKLQHICG